MEKILLAVVMLLSLSASAIELSGGEDGAVFIKLSAEEAQSCKAEGGCAIVSAAGLRRVIERAYGTSL